MLKLSKPSMDYMISGILEEAEEVRVQAMDGSSDAVKTRQASGNIQPKSITLVLFNGTSLRLLYRSETDTPPSGPKQMSSNVKGLLSKLSRYIK